MTVRRPLKEKLEEAFKVENLPLQGGNDTALPRAIDPVGRRIEVEFWCAECKHYTYVRLNLGLNGNHVMNCPNCGHKHYRLVQRGVITSDRFTEGQCIADEIVPMKSACVPQAQRRERGQVAILREMEALGLLTEPPDMKFRG